MVPFTSFVRNADTPNQSSWFSMKPVSAKNRISTSPNSVRYT